MSPPPGPVSLPDALTKAVNEGLTILRRRLTCEMKEAQTHRVVIVAGWAEDAETLTAIAAYFVGLLAIAVSRALQVRAKLENTPSDKLELLQNVISYVGSKSQPLTPQQKTYERNPWMAEALWHLCLFLAASRPELHPFGTVIALDFPHISAKDHGFDVVALYNSGTDIGISFAESKAYENDPNGAMNDAVQFYKDFDAGEYGVLARQVVTALRDALPPDRQQGISTSLWKDHRTYLPNPHYSATIAVDWTNSRPSLKALAVTAERIAIMPHAVSPFGNFFDSVGDHMTQLAEALQNV